MVPSQIAPGVAVRIRDDDDAFGSVFAGVESFVAQLAVAKRLGTAERRLGIALPRLVRHDENDFAVSVDTRIVVVAQLRSRDAVAGKDELSGETSLVGKTRSEERRV